MLSRRSLLALAAAALTVAITIVGVPAAGAAEPTDPAAARSVWVKATQDAEMLAEKLDAADEAVTKATAREKAAQQAAHQASTTFGTTSAAADVADARAQHADQAADSADQALSDSTAELAADQQSLDAIANAAVQNSVPIDAESILTASSADNLLDKEQTLSAVARFKQSAMTKAQADKAQFSIAQQDADEARTTADHDQAAADDARDEATAAKSAADQALVAATKARTDALTAQASLRQAARASRAQASKAESLFLKLTTAQQVAVNAEKAKAHQQGAALVSADASLQITTAPSFAGLNPTQVEVAKDIAGVALSRGLGKRGVLIGIMTGLTESMLTPVDHGDSSTSSSLGVFQQLNAWGTVDERMNPSTAAGLFYDRMVGVSQWQTQDPWVVAQTVQGSEFSDGSNYEEKLGQAQTITDAVVVTVKIDLSPPSSAPAKNPQAQLAVDFAMMQIGKDYAAGATGPADFDASGTHLGRVGAGRREDSPDHRRAGRHVADRPEEPMATR